MALPVEDVLAVWRQLETAYKALPDDAPERGVIHFEIARMRVLYRKITESGAASGEALRASADTIERARRVLERTSNRPET